MKVKDFISQVELLTAKRLSHGLYRADSMLQPQNKLSHTDSGIRQRNSYWEGSMIQQT